jgi:hypothetical protein
MKTKFGLITLFTYLSLFCFQNLGHAEAPFVDKRRLSSKLESKSEKIIALLSSLESNKDTNAKSKTALQLDIDKHVSTLTNFPLYDLQLAVEHYSKEYVKEELNGVRTTLKESERQKAKLKAKSIHNYIEKIYQAIEKVKETEKQESKANSEDAEKENHKKINTPKPKNP